MGRRDAPRREPRKTKKKAGKDVASYTPLLATREIEVVKKKRKPKARE